MLENLYPGSDLIATNLAQIARDNDGARDNVAMKKAVELLQEYYSADNEAFSAANLKPLSFRDGAMHKAIDLLENTDDRSAVQTSQLTVLKSAIELEAELLLDTNLTVVAPDIHHWDFSRPSDLESDYTFGGPGGRPLIEAWPELRYAGLLSNPHDPTKPEFDADFVLNPQRLSDRAAEVAEQTGHTRERLLNTVFVNAAQVLGRRVVHGTPENQVAPAFWVSLADTAQKALDLGPK